MYSNNIEELEILNKLINFQITINDIPVDENLSNYIYSEIKSLGIVDKCCVFLTIVQRPIGDYLHQECETCMNYKTSLPCCKMPLLPNTFLLDVSTKTNNYGCIAISFFDTYSDAINNAFKNFANLVAINIENHLRNEQIESKYTELGNYKKQLDITIAKRTEELSERNNELRRLYDISRKSEMRLASIFRVAPTCIGIVKNRILFDVNDYMCKLLGYAKDDLIGKSARILYPSEEEFLYVGEEKYRQILNFGIGTVETKWVKKNGEIIEVILSSTPIDYNNASEGTTFTAVDVTPLKRAINQSNTALRRAAEEQEKFKNVFDHSLFPIAIAENNGKMLSFNRSFVDTFGYTIDDIPDIKTWLETVYEDAESRELVKNEWTKFTEFAEQNKEPTVLKQLKIKCKNGEFKNVEITSFYLKNMNFAMFNDITDETKYAEDLRKTIEELQKSKANLQALIENTNESIWAIDKNQNLMYANQVFLREFEFAYGVKLEIGTKLIDLMQGEARDLWRGYYHRAYNGERFTIENQIQTNRGNEYIQVSINPIYINDEIIGVSFFGKNITEKKLKEIEILEAKEKAEQSELLLNEMGEIAKIGGWSYDLATQKLTWTKEVYNIHEVSYDYEPTIEEGISFYYGDSKHIITELVNNAIATGKPFEADLEILTAKGKILQVRAQGKAIFNEKGEPTKLYGAFQDITERKNIEKELIFAKNKAEESDRLKSAFLLNLSHEIRTPLNGILGFLNLLEEPDLSKEEIQEYVQLVNRGSERLIATINDIIEISRIQANEVRLVNEMVNIRAVLKSHYTIFKNQIKELGLEFVLKENLPNTIALVETDVAKLDSILLRLIQNALKFTKKGSIEIGNYLDNHEVVFYVKDTGKGIAEEHFEDIFKPFYQVDTNLARDHEGSGLGLSIAKAYVEMLGGRIWLESEIDVGSTFYFSIPIVKTGK